MNRLGRIFLLCACVCAISCAATANASGSENGPENNVEASERDRLQGIVDALKTRLSIPQTVKVSMVIENPRLLSVARAPDQPEAFLVSVERDFAEVLSEPELAAAIAHELGHVWIFTHFPFLQTEDLANEIAARVVSPDTLAPMYEKVWKHAGAAAKP
jgi:hypothetical protein